MKFVLVVFAFLMIVSSASARVICGVEVGNKEITIVANACMKEPFTLAEATRMFSYPTTYFRKCSHQGRKLFVGVRTREGTVSIFDFYAPATKACVNPINLETEDSNFSESSTTVEI